MFGFSSRPFSLNKAAQPIQPQQPSSSTSGTVESPNSSTAQPPRAHAFLEGARKAGWFGYGDMSWGTVAATVRKAQHPVGRGPRLLAEQPLGGPSLGEQSLGGQYVGLKQPIGAHVPNHTTFEPATRMVEMPAPAEAVDKAPLKTNASHQKTEAEEKENSVLITAEAQSGYGACVAEKVAVHCAASFDSSQQPAAVPPGPTALGSPETTFSTGLKPSAALASAIGTENTKPVSSLCSVIAPKTALHAPVAPMAPPLPSVAPPSAITPPGAAPMARAALTQAAAMPPAGPATCNDFIATDNLANLALSGGMSCYSHKKLSPENFVLLKVIGKGSYGKVMMVRHKADGNIYAMKMLRKENVIKRNQVEHTKTERHVLESISHPFIVQLHFAFQTPKKLYFVMGYCPGGELFFHLARAGRFNESRARFYAAEIVLALEYLHKLDVVYRDLKPENVLLDEEGHVRLTDFGLSKEGVQDNFSAKSLCGTPEYLAPEILNRTGHGKAVDWWSLGALIYEMLTGLPPFYTRDREKLFENIRHGELRYPAYLSPAAKSLLMGLFQRNPDCRLGGGPRDAEEIRHHPFFAIVNWERVYQKKEVPPFRPTLISETDVQYFDKEFVRLPVNNSEVPDSAMSQAVRDEVFQGFSYDGREDGGLQQRFAEGLPDS